MFPCYYPISDVIELIFETITRKKSGLVQTLQLYLNTGVPWGSGYSSFSIDPRFRAAPSGAPGWLSLEGLTVGFSSDLHLRVLSSSPLLGSLLGMETTFKKTNKKEKPIKVLKDHPPPPEYPSEPRSRP